MAEDIDPAWEYWTPDPEIEELLGPPGWDPVGSILDHRMRDNAGRVTGFRFGRRPDGKTRVARGTDRVGGSREFPPVTCPCGYVFRPVTPKNRFCSRACVVYPTRLPVRDCLGCGSSYRPKYGRQVYCSRPCVPKPGGVRVLPDYVCRTCGKAFRPTCARRKICSPACLRNKGAPRRLGDVACAGCGKTFRPDRASRKYCSFGCSVSTKGGKPCRS